ncbi:MAG TPA: MFS transporter [Xanthobacteraceae bacterium]|nr:MFS transporter [Xanthobacteraceae bacterium]
MTVSTANQSRPSSAGRDAFAFLLLWLAGVCLRITALAIPPVIPLLHRDLHLSETDIGWLSSLPPMLFALAAIPGAVLIARFGIVPALVVGLFLNAIGSAARAALPNAAMLYATTMIMAGGISIMQPALPPLVRAWFPRRIGFATAVYTNGLLVGETVAVALTIPLVLPLVNDSWRLSFVVWSVPVLATALLVLACAPRPRSVNGIAAAGRAWWPDWRRPLIWRLGAILGSVNSMYFVTNAFLPDFLTAAGRPDLISSALTAENFCQLPASLIMLAVAGRLVKQPWAYVAAGALSLMSLVGIMTAASGAWIVFWSGVLGFVTTAILVLSLALPSVLSAPDDVHRTSAGMFTISYSIAMVLSVLGGWLWDFTHTPIAGFVPVALCAVVVMALASTANHPDHPENAA